MLVGLLPSSGKRKRDEKQKVPGNYICSTKVTPKNFASQTEDFKKGTVF
jgi:hypothetical protein